MANDAGPEAKQWALAATAVLTTLTRREPRHDLLGGAPKSPEGTGTARTILASSWGIDGREKLVSTLEWLGSRGHSADYQAQAAAFAQAPPQQRQQDPALAFVNQFGAEIGNRALLAWDLGRLLAVAGWGFLAELCSEEEAWGALLSSGVRLRSTYASWDEYAKHYRLGATFADAASAAQLDPILAQLTSAPNSPWRAMPWRLDNAPASPPGAPVGAPVGGAVAPPGPPGTPAAYGGVPVIAPPGQPGAPTSYGGVPVIAPPPADQLPPPPPMPGALGAPGAPGGSKKGLIIGLVVGGVLVLVLLIVLVVHFMHHGSHEHEHTAPPPAPAPAPAPREGKHGKH
jgi:hypothetical protein